MEATLVHNPGAGKGEWSKDRLLELMTRAGIDCDYWSFDDEPLQHQARLRPSGPILIAGGDGAVSGVLKELVDRSRPFGILPTGGSNNMARSLGVFGSLEEIVAGLPQASQRSFGLLQARSGSCLREIAEAIGVGALNGAMDKDSKTRSTAEKRADGREMGREAIEDAKPIDVQILVDGQPLDEDLLFVEALNVPMIGPHLRLGETPHDAGPEFDVAWLPKRDAKRFIEWLRGRAEAEPAPLQRKRARRLLLKGVHEARIDDDFVRYNGAEILVENDAPAFCLLTPELRKT